jgi:hypothetical protein
MNDLTRHIRDELDRTRVFDVHSHLGTRGSWRASTLADIVSYHWLAVELGRVRGRAPEASPGTDPEGFMREVLPCFPAIRNTVNHYAMMGMLRDLYGVGDRTITEGNWEGIDAAVRKKAADPGWFRSVLERARIERVCVAYDEEGAPEGPPGWRVPYEYGEYCLSPAHVDDLEELTGGGPLPATAEDLAAAIRTRVEVLAKSHRVKAFHVWRRGWRYTQGGRDRADSVYKRMKEGGELPHDDWLCLAGLTADAAAEAAGKAGAVIQLFDGMIRHTLSPVGVCEVSHWDSEVMRSLPRYFHAHQGTKFDYFLGTRIPSHEAASLARVYANMMVSGAWWHGFTPGTLHEFFRDRLEMLPSTCWNAFYSDAYMVEWVYAKLLVTKNRLALALAGMVEEGFLVEEDCAEIAQRVLFDNAAAAYGG